MSGESPTAELSARARRVVVKVGTGALTGRAGRLDTAFVAELSGQIAEAFRAGREMALVSSGAIGAGIAELDLPGRPRTLPLLQATAAVGQGQLMRTFHDAFERFGVKVAQILLTRDDFQDRARYLNIRNTIAALADPDDPSQPYTVALDQATGAGQSWYYNPARGWAAMAGVNTGTGLGFEIEYRRLMCFYMYKRGDICCIEWAFRSADIPNGEALRTQGEVVVFGHSAASHGGGRDWGA